MNRFKAKRWAGILVILSFVLWLSYTVAAMEHGLGDIPLDPAEYQKYLRLLPLVALPVTYDARGDGIVTPPKDQGSCGSCWSFASTGAFESHLLKEFSVGPTDLSEQQQISCNFSMDGCCGGSMSSLQWWQTRGPIYEDCFPYGEFYTGCPPERTVPCADASGCEELSYRVKDYHTVDTGSPSQVKTSTYDYGPSYFRFDVYSDFPDFWSDGEPGEVYVNISASARLGGHAILIIGWDDIKGAYLCKNSWGDTDGPNGDGTFWMAYSGHAHDLGFGMANFSLYSWGPVYARMFDDADSEADLSLLRRYREEILMSVPKGRKLVRELYQEHSAELSVILLTHPLLMKRAASILEKSLPEIRKALDGGTMEIPPSQIENASKLLNDIASVSSPEMKAYISSVQEVLRGDLASFTSKSEGLEGKAKAAPHLKRDNVTTTWGAIKRGIRGQ